MVEEKKFNDFKAKTRETLFKHTDAAVESDSRVAEVGSALWCFHFFKTDSRLPFQATRIYICPKQNAQMRQQIVFFTVKGPLLRRIGFNLGCIF